MRRINTLLASMLLALPAAWAQNGQYNSSYCTNETIRGTYSGSCTGWITPAPNASMVQQAAQFTAVTDSDGKITGGGKVSIGGTILDQSFTGTASISANCTGTISYDQKLSGQPAPKLNIVFHVLSNGDEIRGISVDPGTVVVCNVRRMSK